MELTDSAGPSYQSVFVPLDGLEHALGERCRALSAGSWHPSLIELEETLRRMSDQVITARDAVDALQRSQREERRRLGHDMRVALGAIAGWVHILKLEKNASENVLRAADVLDRNVRTLTKVIESGRS